MNPFKYKAQLIYPHVVVNQEEKKKLYFVFYSDLLSLPEVTLVCKLVVKPNLKQTAYKDSITFRNQQEVIIWYVNNISVINNLNYVRQSSVDLIFMSCHIIDIHLSCLQ